MLGNQFKEEQIAQAEAAQKEQARQDQVRADVSKLKQELSELAQIKGGPLTGGEMADAMGRFADRSREAAEAALIVAQQLNLGSPALKGWRDGLDKWLTQAKDGFQTFKQLATSVMNGVQQAFSQGIAGLLSGQMSFGQAMKSIWQGIVQTVAQAVAQMIARWIAMAIARDILKLKENATDGGRTAASLVTATAETWAAYAGIPFAGPILAATQIATMYGSMAASSGLATAAGAKVTAMAVGSRVDNPTLALIGEAGPEVVAPERSFLDWARHLFGMGANLQANLALNDRVVQDYSMKSASIDSDASGYARSEMSAGAMAQGSPQLVQHFHAPVWDPSARGLRQMGENVMDGLRATTRERSVVLRPGQVFGGL
ncbi:hypothetical protein GALL_537820 [mine drainage metagenome]|uniref:Bacteriophage tail tape measure C-terminal domain-containing protein n=1 Tax=mine drainage metagenome TaxID=410659 RepID=A0A1J5P0T5_9ZZZZ